MESYCGKSEHSAHRCAQHDRFHRILHCESSWVVQSREFPRGLCNVRILQAAFGYREGKFIWLSAQFASFGRVRRRFIRSGTISGTDMRIFSGRTVLRVAGRLSPHPNGAPVRLERVIEVHMGHNFGDDQEDRQRGNRNLKGFLAFFFRS